MYHFLNSTAHLNRHLSDTSSNTRVFDRMKRSIGSGDDQQPKRQATAAKPKSKDENQEGKPALNNLL